MKPFTAFAAGHTVIRVPDESALVVQTVSVQVNVTAGHRMGASVQYSSSGQAVTVFLPLHFAYTSSANFDTYHAAAALVLYADASTDIVLSTHSPNGVTGTPFFTVSGNLSDV
ncbi:MAG: hypothetical protein IPL43_11220 [Micropruina sp.]|nr:hypothetical protein [Micropruina sp.]